MTTETKRTSQRCNVIVVDLCVWCLFISIAAGWAFLPPPSCIGICWRWWKEDSQWCEGVWQNTMRTFVVVVVVNVTKISVLVHLLQQVSIHIMALVYISSSEMDFCFSPFYASWHFGGGVVFSPLSVVTSLCEWTYIFSTKLQYAWLGRLMKIYSRFFLVLQCVIIGSSIILFDFYDFAVFWLNMSLIVTWTLFTVWLHCICEAVWINAPISQLTLYTFTHTHAQ